MIGEIVANSLQQRPSTKSKVTAYLPFDIETTGLNAPECEVVSWVLGDEYMIQDLDVWERDILEYLYRVVSNLDKDYCTIITFNGGNFHNGGFDFPFLRTRFLMNGLPWPFKGALHIDIYPLIQKRFNTAILTWPRLEDLTKDQLIELIQFFEQKVSVNKSATKPKLLDYIRQNLSGINDYIRDNIEPKKSEINDLKGAYQLLTGDASGEEMDGGQVVKLWQQYTESHDETILNTILEYNHMDTEKTLELFNIVLAYCGLKDLQGERL